MSKDCRQHYNLAMGAAVNTAPSGPSTATPAFKKGGFVAFKKGAQNKAGSHGHSKPFAGKSS